MYVWALKHWNKYGECPTIVTTKDNFPTARILKVEDTVEYLLDQMVDARRRQATVEMIQDAAAMIDDDNDFDGALSLVRQQVALIEDEGSFADSDVDVTQTTEDRLEHYAGLKDLKGGMLGYATGKPTIDRATNGLQGGQLITVVAQPKAGKSTLMVDLAKYMHQNSDIPVLVVSFEMTNAEQEMRLDAMIGKVSASRLRTGRLNPLEEERLRKGLKAFSRREEFWLTSDIAGATVSGIAAKVEKYKPAVVLIDGVYLMIDEISKEQNTPQALTNITRNMKRLALRTHLPVVISTQALTWKMTKKKVTADSIGYSSSFFQDSDVILGLEHVMLDDGEPDELQRRLKVIASRNSPNVAATLLWDWESSTFEENGEYFVEDVA